MKNQLRIFLRETIDLKMKLLTLGETKEQHHSLYRPICKDPTCISTDNAPAHSALSVKRFLARDSIPVLKHPPSSPDLAPCDFYLFPKVKSALKGTRFESVEAVKEKAARVLKELTKDDFQHCFQQWKIRMERCRDREGVYIEGDNK
ncbi:putative mariner transposase [Trichonephila clavipes]|nr:putative mariner transposase [Trichonephila clavipes]